MPSVSSKWWWRDVLVIIMSNDVYTLVIYRKPEEGIPTTEILAPKSNVVTS